MESALRPREIQSRIRAGQSVAEVAEAAGVPETRIEPYALPVLAEREHIAALATRSTVRRRGETSGHRNLKTTVDERLAARGVDPASVAWDSSRAPDGRWAVCAEYSPQRDGDGGEQTREAVFIFDVTGRFSVAGNDEARLVLGDTPPGGDTAAAVRRREDLSSPADPADELALVRAVQQPADQLVDSAVSPLQPPEVVSVIEVVDIEIEVEPAPEPEVASASELANTADAGPAVPDTFDIDTLYDLLDDSAEDSVRIYRSLDGEGVSAGGPVAAWEPEILVAEPSETAAPDVTPDDPPSDDTSEEEEQYREHQPQPAPVPETEPVPQTATDEPDFDLIPASTGDDAEVAKEDQVPAVPGEPEPRDPDAVLAPDPPIADREDQTEPALVPEPNQPRPAARRRKRASVPSWDEIMFGGPKPS